MRLQTLEPQFGHYIDGHPLLAPYRAGEGRIEWCAFTGRVCVSAADATKPWAWIPAKPCEFPKEPKAALRKEIPADRLYAAHEHICLSCPREREERHALFHPKPSTITARDTLRLLLVLDEAWTAMDQRCEQERCQSRRSTRGDSDAAYLWYKGTWHCYLCKCDLKLDPEWTDALYPVYCQLPHPEVGSASFPKAEAVLQFRGAAPVAVCRFHRDFAPDHPVVPLERPCAV